VNSFVQFPYNLFSPVKTLTFHWLFAHIHGGGVWKSNPPFDPRRAESPALKAGKVTGPHSPPLLQYHHSKTFS